MRLITLEKKEWSWYGVMSKWIGLFLVVTLICFQPPSELEGIDDTHWIDFGQLNKLVTSDVLAYDTILMDDELYIFRLLKSRSHLANQEEVELAEGQGLDLGGWIVIDKLYLKEGSYQIEEVYRSDYSLINPWALQVGDMENDGLIDIFIGAYRGTQYYGPDKRPFLLTFNGKDIAKRWTGSAIGYDGFDYGVFKDYDGDGYDELCLQVTLKDGQVINRYYRWNSFSPELLIENHY